MDQETLIKAKWLVPVSLPPIEDGYLLLKDGKISSLGRMADLERRDFEKVFDFSSHIVMPGLVNSHAHLGLSKLKGKIQEKSFTQWIRLLMSEILNWNDGDYRSSAEQGIEELVRSGITTVGDVSRNGLSFDGLQKRGLRGVVFLEVLGLKQYIENERMRSAKEFLASAEPDQKVHFGLSPHAPYSVSRGLLVESCQYAWKHGLPVSIHCAETEEEIEFIQEGTGRIREMLEEFGLMDEDWQPPGISPVAYLAQTGVLKGSICIHMNILEEKDVDLLKTQGVKVVCCPGTNAWFSREKVCPIDTLLKRDIHVSLGTDSLASNDRLNMFAEMRLVRKYFPSIPSKDIVVMATMGGARTLGMEEKVGSFDRGKEADIVSILTDKELDDPYDFIVNSAEGVGFMMVAGKEILLEKE
jgi:cytosine/adenosine deaminase-related metal-dependent hydrolase